MSFSDKSSTFKRRDILTGVLYARALLSRFRWTLLLLAVVIAFGGLLHASLATPKPDSLTMSFYDAWMALLGENVISVSDPPLLTFVFGTYPLIGFILVGEGIVRLALLASSKEQSAKEWTKLQASTYRNHVVLCGIGHLGFRVLEELVGKNVPTVAIESNPDARFLNAARAKGVPVLVCDMKDDESLRSAGVQYARAIVIATNDDMANLEVALDARRMNPKIRTLMRLFDQQIAAKISGPLSVDVAFSSSALAAPIVAALTLESTLLASFNVGGVPHLSCEVHIEASSKLAGMTSAQLEAEYGVKILRAVDGHIAVVGESAQVTRLAAAAKQPA